MSYLRHFTGTESLPPHTHAPSSSTSLERTWNTESRNQETKSNSRLIPALSSSREHLDIPLRHPSSRSIYIPGAGDAGFVLAKGKRSTSLSPPRASTRSRGNGQRSRSRSPCTSRGKENGLMEILLHRPGAIDGTKLSVVSVGIQKIDVIPPRISSKVKTVYLSNNDISDIRNVPQFVNCVNLSLANNLIKVLGDVDCLKRMDRLDKLTLEGNPITSMP